MNYTDTIAAVSTASGRGGVAVIRISGKEAFAAADRVFRAKNGRSVLDFAPRNMVYGSISLGERAEDSGLCVTFPSPHSFTGEDVVELHCHGGPEISRAIIRELIRAGCRAAERGEFTRRAFLNGKIDLSGAEGLIQMIDSGSRAELAAASRLLKGELSREIIGLQAELKDAISYMEVILDYPEEDIPELKLNQIEQVLIGGVQKLDRLCGSYRRGRLLSSGITVAICGRANAGKSSLLNRILGEDRAIVSDIEGTTRDTVEGAIELSGIRVNFIDTAGLRATGDRLELLGIERSKEAVKSADIVVRLIDGEGDDGLDDELIDKTVIEVNSKGDLRKDTEGLTVSSVTGEGVDGLLAKISEIIGDLGTADTLMLTNERHYGAALRAKNALENALVDMYGKPLDMLSADVTDAWSILGEITGETAAESIVDNIFEKFCLGK